MKAIKYLFFLIGLFILPLCGWWAYNNYQFVKHAQKSTGKILELLEEESSSSKKSGNISYVYYPVIEFSDSEGKMHKFKGSSGSNPPAYEVGETVTVLYEEKNPKNASLEGVAANFLGPIIVGSFGFIFFAIGGGMIFYGRAQKNKKDFLLSQGQVVQANFKEVALNRSLSINGKNPFLIIAQWHNPQTQQIHLFESENLWFDPSEFIKSEVVKVYIDPNNAKKYYMDISFLPSLA